MSTIAWYKKQMENPELDTTTYLNYWNILRDLEQRAAATYNEGMERIAAQEQK